MKESAGRSSNPLVSVILPTYNRCVTLPRAVESVLGQSYGEVELIVVDDGSSDATKEVMKGIEDPRLRYIRLERNVGVARARNVALGTARGELISFQDSDDEWLPDKLEKQLKALESHPEAAVAYTDMIWIAPDGRQDYMSAPEVEYAHPVGRGGLEYQAFRIGIQTVLAWSHCFQEVGGFDESLPRFVDLDLLIRFSMRYSFVHLREPLVKYYCSHGISSNMYNEFLARRILLDKYAEHIGGNKSFIARQYYCMGRALVRSGNFREGRKWLRMSFRAKPFTPIYLYHAFASSLGQKAYRAITSVI